MRADVGHLIGCDKRVLILSRNNSSKGTVSRLAVARFIMTFPS